MLHRYRNHFGLRKEVLHDRFLCYKFYCVHLETYIVLHIFCLLTSVEPILIPNGGLLHLHANDMNCFVKKKFIGTNIIIITGDGKRYILKYQKCYYNTQSIWPTILEHKQYLLAIGMKEPLTICREVPTLPQYAVQTCDFVDLLRKVNGFDPITPDVCVACRGPMTLDFISIACNL